jgi:hypothetical protein
MKMKKTKINVDKIDKETPTTKIVLWGEYGNTIIDELDIPHFVSMPGLLKIDGDYFQRLSDRDDLETSSFSYIRIKNILELEEYKLSH